MRYKIRTLCFIFVVIFLLLSGCSEKNLVATGTIQGKEVLLSSEVSAQCENIFVEEGQEVKTGQKLIKLDDTYYKQVKNQAEANYQMFTAQLNETLKGAREEEVKIAQTKVAQLAANIEASSAQLENVKKNIVRYEELLKIGAITQQTYDEMLTSKIVLEKQIKALEKQKEAATLSLTLLEKGAREETVDRLEAQAKSAQANMEAAEYSLSKTLLDSPVDGIINSVNIEVGEYVSAGTSAVSIIDPEELWVKVYLPENVMGRVQIGNQVEIMIDTFKDKKFKGKVVFISDKAQFTPKNVQTKDQRTTMVFPVKVKILEGFEQLKIGLPADVYFYIDQKGEQ